MHNPGLLVRAWRCLFGDPKPVEIWKTESEEFLRKTKTTNDYTSRDHYTNWNVYAIHQRSLTTNNTRIVEDWRLS